MGQALAPPVSRALFHGQDSPEYILQERSVPEGSRFIEACALENEAYPRSAGRSLSGGSHV